MFLLPSHSISPYLLWNSSRTCLLLSRPSHHHLDNTNILPLVPVYSLSPSLFSMTATMIVYKDKIWSYLFNHLHCSRVQTLMIYKVFHNLLHQLPLLPSLSTHSSLYSAPPATLTLSHLQALPDAIPSSPSSWLSELVSFQVLASACLLQVHLIWSLENVSNLVQALTARLSSHHTDHYSFLFTTKPPLSIFIPVSPGLREDTA